MRNGGYFRFPTIHGETIMFVSEDDLWTVDAGGGVARRLTVSVAEVARPAFSPDGSLVAFTGRDEAHPEVYVMAADGGPATRLTHLGASSSVRGWTPQGRIVFASDHAQPFTNVLALHAVGPEGGAPESLPYGLANDVSYGPGGAAVLGRFTDDPARWKRYRGGRAGVLWIDREGDGQFERLLAGLDGNLGSPLWVAGRIWFVSDHEGTGNLYSCTPEGEDLRRHTDHHEFYARLCTTDGTRLVYQHAAEIWLLDPSREGAHRVEIEFRSPRAQRRRRFVEAQRYLGSVAPHPQGHSIALDARGKLFTMPLWEEAVRQYGAPDGVRYRLGRWLNDGESVVAVSDEGGEEHLEVFTPGSPGAPARVEADLGRVVELAASPTARAVAVANHRNELVHVDLDTGLARVLDRSEHKRIEGVTWSPDGAWIAYAFGVTRGTVSIKLCEAATGATHLVTAPEFRESCPSFDPEGRYLYFLSTRVFDPVYDALFFDLGFPRAVRPHLVTLRADARSPFLPKPAGLGEDAAAAAEGDAAAASEAKKPGGKNGKRPAAEPVRIDLAGIERRVLAFPVPEGRYTQVWGIKGKALFCSYPVEGSLNQDWYEEDRAPRGQLEVYDFGEQKHEVLISGITHFTVSADGKTLVYRAGNRLRAVRAGARPDEKTEKDPPSRKSGWIETGRIRVGVDPGTEWRQMYREAWRLQRDNFWTADMSGIDWNAVRDRYLPLAEKVASRLEFSDLIWEMQGELGTSHAYELGGDQRSPAPYLIGHLGADLALDAKTGLWRIARIVRGDSWDAQRSSPLAAPGTGIAEGDTLLAIGGRPVGRDVHPGELLVNQSATAVEITVGDPKGKKPRTVVVQTLRDEFAARYRQWVDDNRERVHTESEGRVGYVHIPDMGAPGYAEFHRTFLSEAEHDALIVDVRFNRGGHVSQLLLEKLARKPIGWDVPRWMSPEPYPADAISGPVVAITNERAGSDGDIFSHCFKLMGIGPLIGKRTWGGVIGIWPRHALVDGGVTTQPEFSSWYSDVGWGLENYGTEPDHEVDIAPQDYAARRDPQLDFAIDLVLRELKESPPARPTFDRRPSLAPPPLPTRAKRR